MINEADLNILVSNVVSENRHKHCRLCLQEITESFVRFEDFVSFNQRDFVPLHEILTELFGKEVCEDIPGVDVVCPVCVQKTLESAQFTRETKRSSQVLNKIFHNLSEALMIDLEIPENFECLYVVVGENDSKVILFDKEDKKGTTVHKLVKEEPKNTKETQSYICDKCLFIAESKAQLKAHCNSEHRYMCIECSFSFETEENLKSHEDRIHKIFVCQQCGRSCSGLDKLKAHEDRHNTKSECPKCGKSYLTKDCYNKHVELCLSEKIEMHPFRAKMEKKFCCDKCGKGYSCNAGLNVHKRFVHGNNKGHTCHVCGKTFSAPSYLKIHMIKHTGEKNFNCGICSKNFVTKEALLYHTRRHTGEKPYSCNLCEERFVNASARAEHIKYKHQSPKYPCDICGKKFFTSGFVRQHRERHFDPMSKLYAGRAKGPPNVPGEHNLRTRIVNVNNDEIDQSSLPNCNVIVQEQDKTIC